MQMRSPGFSLIEVLVAVALLATGLLALAALQGALARSAADAKARSLVVALLAGELDALRATPFTDIASRTVDAGDADCLAPANAVEHAACEGGMRGLVLDIAIAPMGEGALKSARAAARWTAASGETRVLELRTVFGALALEPNHAHAVEHRPLHPHVRGVATD
jgi:prepilin-type N-terminal cleavage/methylation domain-containing protein